MIIKRVELHNYMCYQGEQTIDLTPRPGRPVVVVHGDNGFGKTSLLNAISWCLFGKQRRRGFDAVSVFNWNAAKAGESDCSVKVTFEHDGETYVFSRGYERTGNEYPLRNDHFSGETTSFIRNGETLTSDEAESLLGRILPYRVSELFLFDGEKLSQFEKLVEREEDKQVEELKEKLEMVLGIPALRGARDLAGDAAKTFQQTLDTLITQSGGHEEVKQRLEEVRKQIEQSERQKRDHEGALETLMREREGYEEELAGEEATGELIRRKMKHEKLLKKIESDLSAAEQRRMAAATPLYVEILRPLVKESILELRDEEEASRVGEIKEVALKAKLEFLSGIINSGERCLCGRALDEASLVHLKAREGVVLDKLRDVEKGGHEPLPWGWIADHLEHVLENDPLSDYLEEERKVSGLMAKRTDTATKIKDIEKGLRTSTKGRIRDLSWGLAVAERSLGDVERRLHEINENLKKYREERRKLEAEVGKGGRLEERLKLERNRRDVADEARETFEKAIEELRQIKREEVEKWASDAFLKMRRKEEFAGLRINESYGLYIITTSDEAIPARSAGEGQIVALSLLTGLNKSAELRAPIVMDTPFGRLDRVHRANVLEHLSDMGDQIVLLATSAEVDEDDVKKVADSMAQEWRIDYLTLGMSRFEKVG
jgi:DNA sulfur modification protein DndD